MWFIVLIIIIQDVIQATRMLPYIGGRTNTTAALRMLRDVIFQRRNGDRRSVRNVAILIANGESTLHADQVQLTHKAKYMQNYNFWVKY